MIELARHLWQRVCEHCRADIRWVKGHSSGDENSAGSEIADGLAGDGRKYGNLKEREVVGEETLALNKLAEEHNRRIQYEKLTFLKKLRAHHEGAEEDLTRSSKVARTQKLMKRKLETIDENDIIDLNAEQNVNVNKYNSVGEEIGTLRNFSEILSSTCLEMGRAGGKFGPPKLKPEHPTNIKIYELEHLHYRNDIPLCRLPPRETSVSLPLAVACGQRWT